MDKPLELQDPRPALIELLSTTQVLDRGLAEVLTSPNAFAKASLAQRVGKVRGWEALRTICVLRPSPVQVNARGQQTDIPGKVPDRHLCGVTVSQGANHLATICCFTISLFSDLL